MSKYPHCVFLEGGLKGLVGPGVWKGMAGNPPPLKDDLELRAHETLCSAAAETDSLLARATYICDTLRTFTGYYRYY